jgi:LPXTG-motif cell wall-anchored protein
VTSPGRPATGRRALVGAVVGCAVGAALVLLAANQVWGTVTGPRPAPLPPLSSPRTGAQFAPWLPAVGLVALAGAGALVATRRLGRMAVGVLLLACGGGAVAAAAGAVADGAAVGWSAACAVGGLAVAAAGGAALLRGRGWPAMGARYERAAPRATGGGAALWEALDRGEDPTAR